MNTNQEFNYCHVVGKTDVGRKRAANEDNMISGITPNGLVSVVCDGMGGHVGGATASKIAVETILTNLNAVYYEDPHIAIGESIDRANQAILQTAAANPELSGMGSTCVMVLVRDGKVYYGHVGDSRIYLIRNKRIVQLTKDHSYVQMLVDCGQITQEQAEHHPRKNEITNALGLANMTPATVAEDAISPEGGDCFLLCSDGLSGMISDHTICKVVSKQAELTAQDRVDYLVNLANQNGGLDNITAQIVEFSITPNDGKSPKKISKWISVGIPTLVATIALAVGGYFWFAHEPELESTSEEPLEENISESKIDTMLYTLGSVPFNKDQEFVELNFTDISLEFTHHGEPLYTVNEAFNATSINITSNGIKQVFKSQTSWAFEFTKVVPQNNKVSFCIMTKDSLKVYEYTINVTQEPVKKVLIDKLPKQPIQESIKTDTIPIHYSYDELTKGTTLLLNYFAKAVIRFNDEEKAIDKVISEILKDDLSFNDVNWKEEIKSKNKQLLFKYNGKGSTQQHEFFILCAIKDSKDRICIHIILDKKKTEPIIAPAAEPMDSTKHDSNSNNALEPAKDSTSNPIDSAKHDSLAQTI